MAKITQKLVSSLKPAASAKFIRDDALTGFGVKVSPTGRKSYIVEGRIRGGRTRRITLGQDPAMSLSAAKDLAREYIQLMQKGEDPVAKKKKELAKRDALGKTVGDVFDGYIAARDLKARTEQDYTNAFNLYFSDWKDRPIREITRQDAEDRFVKLRDGSGLATAAKSFRIMSAVFNFALADEVDGERLITENPTDVIKQKGYKRTVKRRTRFLEDDEIAKLIHFDLTVKDWPETPEHGVTDQGINFTMLLLYSGLRKSEGLRLRWDDINWSKGHLVVHDTKNRTDHYIPLSRLISGTLKRQKEHLERTRDEESTWVFPASRGGGHMTEPKSQLKKITEATGIKFGFHDLRRTFATHAEANGIPFDLIRRALNHKSRSVTEGYIITQIDTLRPVFDAVADGYHRYYDPDWEHEAAVDGAEAERTEAGGAA